MLNAQRLAAKWAQIDEDYSDRDISDLVLARQEIELKKIQALFEELTLYAELRIPASGLFAMVNGSQVPVTGNANTGKIY